MLLRVLTRVCSLNSLERFRFESERLRRYDARRPAVADFLSQKEVNNSRMSAKQSDREYQ
jgi:hypothetical protein